MALFRSLVRMGVAEARRGFQSSSQLYENIGVVGIPLSKGQRKTGVDRGPDDLRDFGAVRALTKYGWNVTGESLFGPYVCLSAKHHHRNNHNNNHNNKKQCSGKGVQKMRFTMETTFDHS